MIIKIFTCLMMYMLLASVSLFAENTTRTISSPDGSLELTVLISEEISWELKRKGNVIAGPSEIGMDIKQQGVLGEEPVLKNAFTDSKDEVIDADIYKKKQVRNEYNELNLVFEGDYNLVFRAFNDGVAYRFTTSIEDDIVVKNEKAEFIFPMAETAYVPYINNPTGRYQSSFESPYDVLGMNEIVVDSLIHTPLCVKNSDGSSIVVSEGDLENYPGMFLTINDQANGFDAEYANYPLKEELSEQDNFQSSVIKRAGYLAKSKGKRVFPWRFLAVAQNDYELLQSDMVYKLASPSRIDDVSWIKPGKVAWDWWNAWNIYDVDFRAGINTATYKYYIDFAAQKGLEYVILDDGWSESDDLLKIIPEIDLQEIIEYGKSRGVDIVLWAAWHLLSEQMDEVFEKYSEMGVKGYKIDFMNRDDQKMVNFYYNTARKAAGYEQFVLFHGAYKPTGLHRTYPNVLTFEGVFGLEWAKWTEYLDMPVYNVTMPFIRMLAGPVDYTPGAMKNANRENWRAIFDEPMSQGTRCHQLAMYVVFDSPFSMLADNPSNYLREPECVEFIASVPTVFDETVPLAGEIGEFVAVARRKDNAWYVGAMTSWDEREIEIDFSFLEKGKYIATVFADGINADRAARDYTKETFHIESGQTLIIDMKTGGGWAAIIEPAE